MLIRSRPNETGSQTCRLGATSVDKNACPMILNDFNDFNDFNLCATISVVIRSFQPQL